MLELIYGGSGSGKSSFAESRIISLNKSRLFYLATMLIYDEECRQKILRHQILRKEKNFNTLEFPVDIGNACKILLEIEKKDKKKPAVLLECMSNLLANEMFRNDKSFSEAELFNKITQDITILKEASSNLVIVSNNVFEDGIDYDKTTLFYIDLLGKINNWISDIADSVFEVVVGIPVKIK